MPAFHTLPITILLYASTRLGFRPEELILLFIVPTAIMSVGNVVLPRIQKAAGWSNRTVIIFSTLLAASIPLWAALGMVLPFAGLRTKRSINLIDVVAFVSPCSVLTLISGLRTILQLCKSSLRRDDPDRTYTSPLPSLPSLTLH